MRHYFTSGVCFLLTCIVASGDVLVLKGSNYRHEGTITESGDRYKIITLNGGMMMFPKDAVESVIRKPLPADPSTPTGPDDSGGRQTVVLKDGRRFTGMVNGNNRPGHYLIFTANDGVQIVRKDEVAQIIGTVASSPRVNPTPVPPPPAPHLVERPAVTPPPPQPAAPPPPSGPAPGTVLAPVAVSLTPSELASTIQFRVQKTIVLEKNLKALKGGKVVAISPDLSRCVLQGKHYSSVDMVNLETGQVIPFTTMFDRSWLFAFSPDSRFLAGAGMTPPDSKDRAITIRLWDVQSGRELAVLDKMPDAYLSGSAGATINAITFDRTSGYVAITGYWSAGRATDPSIIKIYAVGGGQYRKLQDLKLEHGVAGNAPLAFSPDNKAIYVIGYPPSNKPELHRVSLAAPNSPLDVVWNNDDRGASVFASGVPLAVRRRNSEEVFDLEKKQVIGTFGTSHELEEMAFSPDNRLLCVGTGGHINLPDHLAVWDVVERKRVSVLPESEKFDRPEVLRFSTDGRKIAAYITTRREIRIWEMTTAPVTEPPALQLAVKETRQLPGGYPVAVSRDFSRCLLARNDPAQTVLCDTSTGKELAAFDGSWHFQFSPDSKYLAGCGGYKDELYVKHTNTIRLWDARTGQEVATLERMSVDANFSSDDIHHSPVVFDRAGNSLAVVCCGSVKLFSIAGNSFRKVLERPLSPKEGQPQQAMFAPDGRSLYLRFDVGSGPHTIRRVPLVEGAAPIEYIGSIDSSCDMTFCHAKPMSVRMTGFGIEIWDHEKKSQVGKINAGCLEPADVSLDDRLFCSHGQNTGLVAAGLTLWSLTECKRLVTVNLPRPKLIAFSSDGPRLAVVNEGQMSVFEISQPAFNQPGSVVAGATSTNTPPPVLTADESRLKPRLVNVREIMPSPDHPPTWSYRLMPDGKTLLYAAVEQRGRSYKLRLRDIATGNENPLPFPSHDHYIELCHVLAANCVTPDGKTIIIYTGIDENKDGVIQPTEKKSIALYTVATGAVRDLGVQDDSVFASLEATGKMLFIGTTKNNAPFPSTQKIYSTLLDNIAVRPLAIGGSIHHPCPTATLLPVDDLILPSGKRKNGWPQLYDYYAGKLFDIRHGIGNSLGMWTSNGRYFYARSCWDRVRGETVAKPEDIGRAIGPGPTPSSMVVAHSGGIALHDPEKQTTVRLGEPGLEPISAFGKTLIYRARSPNNTIFMADIEMPPPTAKP